METQNTEMGNSGVHQVNSRWNPTKEQISILENMYGQGIRTPTADQIQQITTRLKAFGDIEGKNVFYWFQNHKARQRQKQKQENLASITRYLHKSTHPMFPVPPPFPNGVCGTYYLPQGEIGCYQQYPKVLIPCTAGFKRRQKMEKLTSYGCAGYEAVLPNNYPHNNEEVVESGNNRGRNQQTLPLFPLHPTGTLQDCDMNVFSNNSASSSSESTMNGDEDSEKPFFDFFSTHLPFQST